MMMVISDENSIPWFLLIVQDEELFCHYLNLCLSHYEIGSFLPLAHGSYNCCVSRNKPDLNH